MGDIATLENRKRPTGGLPVTGGTGIVVQTGPAITVARTLQAGPGIDITNADGVAGDPVIGLLEMPSAPVELAKLGLPFSGGTWAPAEFIGRNTESNSTPIATEAGGFLECDGKSRIDRFLIKTATPYPPFVDYSVEIWQLDEFGNSTQAISDTSGLPITITVPAGSTVGMNTTDVYTQLDNITLQVRSDPSVGWSPIQCQVVARRVKAI